MTHWTLSPWIDSGQVHALFDPDGDHTEAGGKPLHEWYAGLRGSNRNSEAIYFLALALPRYECVVWAAQALLEIGAIDRTDPAVVAVLRWIDSPDDDLRRAAGAEAERIRRTTPAKLLAMAVQFSGGSIVPPEFPPQQPPAEVCGQMAGGALVAAVYAQPDPAAAIARVLALGEAMVTRQ